MDIELNWREIRRLHEELSDPFIMMPISGATSSLSQALFNAHEDFNNYMGPTGVARKFWTVPCELIHDEIGVIIGNSFVLAQVAISQAVSIFVKLRESCLEKDRYPKLKNNILSYHSKVINVINLNEILTIDAIANYFKHHHEWPDSWNESESKGVQKLTIEVVKKIGFSQKELTENMQIGIHRLGICDNNLVKLCDIVAEWREKLAIQFSKDPQIASCL